ncbi:MAG: hypothetical protein ABFS39_12080 [Pseudomonadota bacterium]
MWIQRLISPDCCGGPVLTLALLCLSIGVLFVAVSATLPGIIFIGVGLMTEAICLYMSRTRCIDRYHSRKWAD